MLANDCRHGGATIGLCLSVQSPRPKDSWVYSILRSRNGEILTFQLPVGRSGIAITQWIHSRKITALSASVFSSASLRPDRVAKMRWLRRTTANEDGRLYEVIIDACSSQANHWDHSPSVNHHVPVLVHQGIYIDSRENIRNAPVKSVVAHATLSRRSHPLTLHPNCEGNRPLFYPTRAGSDGGCTTYSNSQCRILLQRVGWQHSGKSHRKQKSE